jgi:hypothetical protein
MDTEPDDLRILRLHKTWADRHILIWQFFILLLFGGIYFLLEKSGIDAAERAGAFVLLAVMVLAATIWLAVALGVARVHMLLKGIDLESLAKRAAQSRRDRQ